MKGFSFTFFSTLLSVSFVVFDTTIRTTLSFKLEMNCLNASIIATIAVTFISNYLNKQIVILSGLPILEDDTSFINDCINLQRSHREIILGQFLYIISNILLEVALIL